MPHAVIEGKISPREIWERFTPLQRRRGTVILKLERAWLDRAGQTVLFEAITISEGFRQHFFLQAVRKGEDGITVRLEPLTDPEKTDAVRRCLAMTSLWIRDLKAGLVIGSTNLETFLAED